MLVCFMLTAGLLNTNWVVSNGAVTRCINLPLCAALCSSGCVNSKHTPPPVTDVVPVFVVRHPVTLGVSVLSWQAHSWASALCVSALPWLSLLFGKDTRLLPSQ